MSPQHLRPARTVLAQLIRQRNMTLEEFTTYAEQFAREHGEPGTLSYRHLQRLVAGTISNVRPATSRLLERVLGHPIGVLLSTADGFHDGRDEVIELQQRLSASRRVDKITVDLLAEQVQGIRRIDRQLGAVIAHADVTAKVDHIVNLFNYSLMPSVRASLAALLSELYALAGWQALDMGRKRDAWQYNTHARIAAAESGVSAYVAHAAAGQSFVLLEIGHAASAANLLSSIIDDSATKIPRLLHSWLAGAHGETLAANAQQDLSLRAFDLSERLLPIDATVVDCPYVVLNSVHLARWQGHALARFGRAEAINILYDALTRLDPTFVRAEAALRIDLAIALHENARFEESIEQLKVANPMIVRIGSKRQINRISRSMRV